MSIFSMSGMSEAHSLSTLQALKLVPLDCELVGEDGSRVSVHRSLLCLISPLLARLLALQDPGQTMVAISLPVTTQALEAFNRLVIILNYLFIKLFRIYHSSGKSSENDWELAQEVYSLLGIKGEENILKSEYKSEEPENEDLEDKYIKDEEIFDDYQSVELEKTDVEDKYIKDEDTYNNYKSVKLENKIIEDTYGKYEKKTRKRYKIKEISCDMCPKMFSNNHSLGNHISKKHLNVLSIEHTNEELGNTHTHTHTHKHTDRQAELPMTVPDQLVARLGENSVNKPSRWS